eukprot:4391428-Pyramimonas_sp.AAC.1
MSLLLLCLLAPLALTSPAVSARKEVTDADALHAMSRTVPDSTRIVKAMRMLGHPACRWNLRTREWRT